MVLKHIQYIKVFLCISAPPKDGAYLRKNVGGKNDKEKNLQHR